MIIHKQTEWIRLIIITGAVGLCTTSCDNGELFDKQQQPESTELHFAAALSDSQATIATRMISGTTFPKGTYPFGLFLTDENGNGLPAGTADNMKSTLQQQGAGETWSHTTKTDVPLTPTANPGQRIKITGYYPWTDGATKTAVPFNLSEAMTGQKDILYLSSPSYDTAPMVPSNGTVALTFSHVCTWVKIRLSSLKQTPAVIVKFVSIGNRHSGLEWVKNKGSFNPGTGDINTGATAGALVVSPLQPVTLPYDGESGKPPLEFDFLVPPVLNKDIQDGDIIIRVTTTDEKVLLFPLKKGHLNSVGNKYGFQKGYKNTYNIVYNNAAMSLSLSGWQSHVINENELGGTTAGYEPWTVTYKDDYRSYGINPLSSEIHIYQAYLGEVAENNNGGYVPFENNYTGPSETEKWKKVTTELVYPTIMVSLKDAAGGAPVPWKDAETGALLAKQLCIDLREGGYKDWRLPRISELKMMKLANQNPHPGVSLGVAEYWSGTEADKTNCLISFNYRPTGASTINYPKSVVKSEVYSVRCIREVSTPLM